MKYEVGRTYECPVCRNPRAKIVWKRKDGRVVGAKCQRSHEHKRGSVILIETE